MTIPPGHSSADRVALAEFLVEVGLSMREHYEFDSDWQRHTGGLIASVGEWLLAGHNMPVAIVYQAETAADAYLRQFLPGKLKPGAI